LLILSTLSCCVSAAALAKRAIGLSYVGGTWGGARRPSPFLCLLLKMLMIQPEKEIVEAFISEKDFRYVRLLGLFYLRLVGTGEEIYKCLESVYSDNRKFKMRQLDGSFTIEYIDDFVDQLLTMPRVCDTTLPPLVQRKVLEDRGVLGKRVSLLDELLKEDDDASEDERKLASTPSHSYANGRKDYEHSSEEEYDRRPAQRRREDDEDEQRGRRVARLADRSLSPSPDRSISRKRAGFRSPSPDKNGSRREHSAAVAEVKEGERKSNRSPESSPARTGSRDRRSPQEVRHHHHHHHERSPDSRETRQSRGQRSPDISTSRRAERSPEYNRRAERSPDVIDLLRSAQRSPDVKRRRDENPVVGRRRSPDGRISPRGRDDRKRPSPTQYRSKIGDRSPVRRRSPDRAGDDSRGRYRERDDRYSRDSRDDRDDWRHTRSREDGGSNKKRSRTYDEDEDLDLRSNNKRPMLASSSSASSSRADMSRSSTYKAPGSGKTGGGGGGLREMSTTEMNDLRKSIGLGPLKS